MSGAGADLLRLDRQLCFPLYAASRLVTRLYQPLLEPLGLTYPQYIILMILWEDAPCPVSHLGDRALLNTNTLTPLLKRLEQAGFITRTRSRKDERVVRVDLTPRGAALKGACACVPETLAGALGIPEGALADLKSKLDALVGHLRRLEQPSC
ncbi:MarR family winged helix-turn-helix transcriptional regulator [Mesoterricola silvestris]|uniref:MarR family transcriptional regulator n=1 Tax=Mesoterricola silvestris TaxID=2927979 RepID=A0AA48GFI3_9BACT|nr:MarR family transcriptional regulator [Mesoterricola silvestris]BDU71696.1 MarR family transcriptional regulator [Mesoterricola silvestris]